VFLSIGLSVNWMITRKSPMLHLQSIPLSSDLPLNADVSATKVATKLKEEL
jgi:hypothetical protein